MSGHNSDTIELLRSPKDIQRGRRRNRNGGGYLSEGGMAAREQLLQSCEELSDAQTYLSDQGLPSERARLAANSRYRELQRSGRREVENSSEENTPLLAAQESESALDGSSESGKPVLLRIGGTAVAANQRTRNEYESVPRSSASEVRANLKKQERTRQKREQWYRIGRICRVVILTSILVACVILFAVHEEYESDLQIISVEAATPSDALTFNHSRRWDHAVLSITGPFIDESYLNKSRQDCNEFLFFCGSETEIIDCTVTDGSGSCRSVKLSSSLSSKSNTDPPIFPSSNVITRDLPNPDGIFQVSFYSNRSVLFQVSTRGELLSRGMQVVVAAVILVGVYVLITFDLVHRILAAFLGSTATLAALSMLEKRPTLDRVVEWIDLDTIFLLFGMMTLVAIFSQTGFFDYAAVKAYKLARGRIGPLVTILCLLSAVVSAFLDNVTTILLLTPVSIRLCQVLNVDPRPVLIAEVVFSNIGGTATAVGDPPNVIIVSNNLIQSHGINFAEFTLHLSLGILLVMVVAYGVLTCIYCTYVRLPNKDPPHIAELKREIAIWERTAAQMPVVSLEETAVRDALRTKASEVKNQLRQEVVLSVQSAQDHWQKNLAQLEQQYRITDRLLLAKCSAVLLVVILLFFLANVIPGIDLEIGWIAIFGAVVLLVLSDTQEMEPVLHKIEWGTLLFFAGLFVLMEGLAELGLIEYIGNVMVELIKMVPSNHQMLVALVLVVWVSALASSFIDNIPFTTATIPVIVELAASPDVCVSLRPLVWALAFGACLGGNGTLIGASANVVCAGIAEQNGYRISFFKFFVIGFPMMLATTFTAMIYLLICHVAFKWNVESSCDA